MGVLISISSCKYLRDCQMRLLVGNSKLNVVIKIPINSVVYSILIDFKLKLLMKKGIDVSRVGIFLLIFILGRSS